MSDPLAQSKHPYPTTALEPVPARVPHFCPVLPEVGILLPTHAAPLPTLPEVGTPTLSC